MTRHLVRRLVWRLVWHACLCLCLASAYPHRAAADPALFAVYGPQAPVYLFGSVHRLPRGIQWRTPTFNRVEHEAASLGFETVQTSQLRIILALLGTIDVSRPLHTLLSPADYATLRTRLAGQPGMADLVDYLQPWLAALLVGELAGGADAEALSPGVDMQIMASARTSQRPVFGLETLSSQLGILGAMPLPEQVAMLHAALATHDSRTLFPRLLRAWRAGDLDAIAAMTSQSLKSSPVLFDRLLHARNVQWVAEIEPLLRRDAPTLLTVGAAHLAGPDGLPVLLQQRGYRVERLQ